jgi:hypothetical protein
MEGERLTFFAGTCIGSGKPPARRGLQAAARAELDPLKHWKQAVKNVPAAKV